MLEYSGHLRSGLLDGMGILNDDLLPNDFEPNEYVHTDLLAARVRAHHDTDI